MKKIIFFVLLCFLIVPSCKASYVVMDEDTGDVILSNAMHEKRLIASITKVMTAYVIISEIDDLDKVVEVGNEVNQAHGSSIYLEVGEKISIRDLLYGMLLRSGNDAATVLSYSIYGDINKFVYLMNSYASKIGMKSTVFGNPTGLDDDKTENISTAYDMALLTKTAMKNAVFREIFQTKKYSSKTNKKSYLWINKNKTLFMKKYITGGKTGYTKKAKRTLITTASNNNMNLIIVTLNVSDDFNFHVNTYDNIFENYRSVLILNKSNIYPFKKSKNIFYVKNNFKKILKKDINIENNFKIQYIIFDKYYKKKKKMMGKVSIFYKNKEIYNAPLYAKYS